MHNIHVYKPSVEIKLASEMSSLEMTDVLESLSSILNNRGGLKDVSIEDLKMLSGRPCYAYIGYSEKDVDDALNIFCLSTAPDDIKALIIYAWTPHIKDAHRIRRFANECTTEFEMNTRWGCTFRKGIDSKLLVLYSTKKAASHQAAEEPYQVEESHTYRQVVFPLGISAQMKKGDIDWNFFK